MHNRRRKRSNSLKKIPSNWTIESVTFKANTIAPYNFPWELMYINTYLGENDPFLWIFQLLVMVRNHRFIEGMTTMTMVTFVKDNQRKWFNSQISFIHCIYQHLRCYDKYIKSAKKKKIFSVPPITFLNKILINISV